MASNFAGSIGIKRLQKSIKITDCTLVLHAFPAACEHHVCICVDTEERFRCTGVMRKRFLHFHKIYVFYVRRTLFFQHHQQHIGFICKNEACSPSTLSSRSVLLNAVVIKPQSGPKWPPSPEPKMVIAWSYMTPSCTRIAAKFSPNSSEMTITWTKVAPR